MLCISETWCILIAFVSEDVAHADDLLYETLTVFETLYFAALLRLPSQMSVAEKTERVESVITTLGLTRCRNTIVGGGFRRGVSGGERKRVSIGHELLINPSAIFLGEPFILGPKFFFKCAVSDNTFVELVICPTLCIRILPRLACLKYTRTLR